VLWQLYAMWRFRGIDPYEAFNPAGCPASPWPGRVEAVLTAFAMEAAGHERAMSDVAEMIPAMLGASFGR
jgi:hypothetical protein